MKPIEKLSNEQKIEEINSYGYFLCEYNETIQINKKENIYDKNGYKYFLSLKELRDLNGNSPYRFRISNPHSIDNINNWIKIENKNFLLIDSLYKGNRVKLSFKCINEECGMEFEKDWSDIFQGHGCPYCAHQKIKYEFSLAHIKPEVAGLWDYEKNYPLTPVDIFAKTPKKFWWKCEKNSKHSYFAQVGNKTNGLGCPQCYGIIPDEDNNLLKNNPELCKEWDCALNQKLPSEYTPFSSKKVNWVCNRCGNKWISGIGTRNRGCGCPKCASSKGEEKIRRVLEEMGIDFKEQYIIKECKNINPLPFDFVILKNSDILMLIEYDGEFHYEEPRFKSGKTLQDVQYRDGIKTRFCEENNINLLRIPYWEYKNIESIIGKELELGGYYGRCD